MCYYINIAIEPHNPNLIEGLFSNQYRVVYTKRYVPNIYAHEWFYVTEIHHQCSCNLYGENDDYLNEINKRMRKYKKMGWSDNKIQRAIGTNEARRKGWFVGIRNNICNLLTKALVDCHVLYLFIYNDDHEEVDNNISHSVISIEPESMLGKLLPLNKCLKMTGGHERNK